MVTRQRGYQPHGHDKDGFSKIDSPGDPIMIASADGTKWRQNYGDSARAALKGRSDQDRRYALGTGTGPKITFISAV